MIAAILALIFFAIGAAFLLCLGSLGSNNRFCIPVGTASLGMSVLLIVLILAINSPTTTTQKTDRTTTNIDTLSLASEEHGSFVLGTGSMDGNEVYYYMAKTPDGDQLRSLNNSENNVFIKQDADGQPALIDEDLYNITHIKNLGLAYWFDPENVIDIIGDNRTGYGNYLNGEVTEKYIFHVPAGTIIQSYKVNTQDLQK